MVAVEEVSKTPGISLVTDFACWLRSRSGVFDGFVLVVASYGIQTPSPHATIRERVARERKRRLSITSVEVISEYISLIQPGK